MDEESLNEEEEKSEASSLLFYLFMYKNYSKKMLILCISECKHTLIPIFFASFSGKLSKLHINGNLTNIPLNYTKFLDGCVVFLGVIS